MSAAKALPTVFRPNQPDVLPETSQTRFRPDEALLADELSNTADLTQSPRTAVLRGFEQMATFIAAAGYYAMDELSDASAAERTQLKQSFG